jgi:MOSC domain-containing protein YiiM
MIHETPITIRHIFVSPEDNYFGKAKHGSGQDPTHDRSQAEVRAGLGFVGDRYYGVAAHFNAQVTFVASEVFDALLFEFGLEELLPVLMRRNIVSEGVGINQLIGQEFEICQPVGAHNANGAASCVRFAGVQPCNPCAWMDAAITAGAWKFLRGRGGLRARVLSDGVLHRGAAILRTAIALDATAILQPLARPRLP